MFIILLLLSEVHVLVIMLLWWPILSLLQRKKLLNINNSIYKIIKISKNASINKIPSQKGPKPPKPSINMPLCFNKYSANSSSHILFLNSYL